MTQIPILNGLGRISQTNTQTEYFLGDALGSVIQLTASNSDVTLAKSYDPYNVVTSTSGISQTTMTSQERHLLAVTLS
jgi:hypothetical protein